MILETIVNGKRYENCISLVKRDDGTVVVLAKCRENGIENEIIKFMPGEQPMRCHGIKPNCGFQIDWMGRILEA